MAVIPCFLCGTDLVIRTDKHTKPYFICDHCGVQAFVRKRTGIVQLEKLLRNLRTQDFQFAKHKESFLKVCAVLNEIDDLKREIEKQKNKIGLFSSNPDAERAIEALRARINALLSVLEQHAENVQPITK
jgi:DNA-directed RNA polymerase subunit RPC12/RpoP